jgi:hypothetical protein
MLARSSCRRDDLFLAAFAFAALSFSTLLPIGGTYVLHSTITVASLSAATLARTRGVFGSRHGPCLTPERARHRHGRFRNPQSFIDMEVHYWKDRDAFLYLKKDHREFSLPP